MIQFLGPLTCDLQNVTDCIGSCFGLGWLVAAYSELVVSGTMLEPVQELPFKILDDLFTGCAGGVRSSVRGNC